MIMIYSSRFKDVTIDIVISVGRRDKTKEVEVEQFKVRYTILFDFVLNCHLSSIIVSD